MRKRPEVVSATALIALAAALLSVSVVAVMLLAAGLSPGWGSQPAEAAHEGGTITLAALDMDTMGNTVEQSPSGNVEETALGTIEECIEVDHPATFDVDFVVQGYPATDSLVGFDVSVTFPAGLTLNSTFAGDVAPSILGRTLISGDPQSGPFTSFVDTPNINNPTARVGPDTHSASIIDFADADPDENIDGEENSDGFLIRYTFQTTAAGADLLPLTLSSLSSFVIDDAGGVPITTIQDGVVAVDTACQALPEADDKPNESTSEDTPVSITLTGSDEETCELTFATAGANNGTLSAITNNACTPGSPNTHSASVTFTPDQDVCDPENGSFTYTVNDGSATSAAATVNITITCVNDPPEANDVDMGEVLMDSLAGAWTPDVSDVDTGDTLTCSVVVPPSHGSTQNPPDCSAPGGYTPDAGFLGTDSFTYRVTDSAEAFDEATVTVEVVLVLSTPTPTPTPTPTDVAGTPTDVAGATPTPTPTAAAAVLPGTGDGISLGGGGSSGLTFLAIGLVLLVVAPGTVAVGVILRRKAKLGR